MKNTAATAKKIIPGTSSLIESRSKPLGELLNVPVQVPSTPSVIPKIKPKKVEKAALGPL
jgi:hypothetical protein